MATCVLRSQIDDEFAIGRKRIPHGVQVRRPQDAIGVRDAGAVWSHDRTHPNAPTPEQKMATTRNMRSAASLLLLLLLLMLLPCTIYITPCSVLRLTLSYALRSPVLRLALPCLTPCLTPYALPCPVLRLPVQ